MRAEPSAQTPPTHDHASAEPAARTPAAAVNQTLRLHILQAAGVLIAAGLLFATPRWRGEAVHELLELSGVVLVLACIFGRLWSILYVGAMKNRELVTTGPFSITRNPLYFFSSLGAAGVGLMFGSIVVAAMLFLLVVWVLRVTASGEARFLASRFGDAYAVYASRTPFFWPRFRLFQTGATVSFSPSALKRTFLDGLWFLAVFPALELQEWLHFEGVLPVWIQIW